MWLLFVLILLAAYFNKGKEQFQGCGQGRVWDGQQCRYPGMQASGMTCPEGLVWDPTTGNCNYPKYLYNRGRVCTGGKVWDGQRCRYPGMQASGVTCPEGMTWDSVAGHCEYSYLLS